MKVKLQLPQKGWVLSSLPCPYPGDAAHKPGAEAELLQIRPGEPQTCFLSPPPHAEAMQASLSAAGRDGTQSWGQPLIFAQH